MKLILLSPQWNRTVEDVSAIFVPGSAGSFEVLRSHAPIVSSLEEGVIRWRTSGGEESLQTKGGVAWFSDNTMKICLK